MVVDVGAELGVDELAVDGLELVVGVLVLASAIDEVDELLDKNKNL